jgi:hypothetical protein
MADLLGLPGGIQLAEIPGEVLGKKPADDTPKKPRRTLVQWLSDLGLTHATIWVSVLAVLVPVAGMVWIFLYTLDTGPDHLRFLGAGMLTALAAMMTGFLAGFILGIPRVVSSGQVKQSNNTFAPSTNLAEISDWVTKLLLGAGLVSLGKLGAPIGHMIDEVATGLVGSVSTATVVHSARLFSGAVLIGFAVIGLLEGYMLTLTWFQAKLNQLAE